MTDAMATAETKPPRKKSKKKLFIIGGVVLALLIIIVANLVTSREKGTEVNSGKVENGDIVARVTATGRVKPKTEVKIQAAVMATIMELPVKEGNGVQSGDLLVKLDQTRYEAAVRMAKATLASSKSAMKQAEATKLEAAFTHNRSIKLFERGLASEEQNVSAQTAHEVAKANFDASQFQVEQAQANLVQAEDELAKTVLRSPMAGVITDLNAEVGEIVLVGTMNNPGTVIMTVADLSEIEVEAEVDETDIAAVKLGQKAKIKVDAFPDTTFEGVVTEVGSSAKVSGFSAQDQVTNFLVKIQFEDAFADLRSGMTAEVDITTAQHVAVQHVPIQAVVVRDSLPLSDSPTTSEASRETSGAVAAEPPESAHVEVSSDKDEEYQGVFLVKDGKAWFVEVNTGIADQQNIEIVSGLSEGQEIVIGPYKMLRKLKHGDKIIVSKSANGDEGQRE